MTRDTRALHARLALVPARLKNSKTNDCSARYKLKGHCHGNFAMFWSKPLKYWTKSLFFNMKLLIQHWEENTKGFLSEEQTIVIF